MRDLIVSLIVICALPSCFRRPLVGLLMFSVLAYMRLQDLAWGFARVQRWSYIVALVTFAGYAVDSRKALPVVELRTVMMTLLTIVISLGFLLSEGEGELEPTGLLEYVKIVVIAIFTTAVVRTRSQLRLLMWVIGMSFAFYGVKSGIAGIVSLGRMHILQGPGGMLYDNNDFALAMVMSVPILLHLGTSERRQALRRPVFLMIPLAIITVALTHSRGGTLALGLAFMVLVWRSRNRIAGFGIAAFLVLAAVALAPETYVERIRSIREYKTDGSAQARFGAWRVAGRMIRDKPIFGVGFDRFRANYLRYEPNPTETQIAGKVFVAHNSYLQIWAECGTVALALYLGLLGLTFIDIWRIRKQARRRYHASWILSYCTMFEAAFASFMLGSVFLNRAHFDLIYHFVAIVLVFGRIARQEMENEDRYPYRPSGAGSRGPLVAVRKSGFGTRRRPARSFRTTPLVS